MIRRPPLLTIPNLLSLLRLLLGLAFPLLPASWRLPAILFGAISDLVDGYLSRRLGVEGAVGRILDPVADKVFVVAVVATLLFEGTVPLWQVALIGLRDWVVLGGAVAALVRYGPAKIKQMPPSLWGKITTALQFAFLVAVLLDRRAALVLLVPTTLFSAAAAIDYVRRFRQS